VSEDQPPPAVLSRDPGPVPGRTLPARLADKPIGDQTERISRTISDLAEMKQPAAQTITPAFRHELPTDRGESRDA